MSLDVLVLTVKDVPAGKVVPYVSAPQIVPVVPESRAHDKYDPVVLGKLSTLIQSTVRLEPTVVVLLDIIICRPLAGVTAIVETSVPSI